MSCCSPVGDSPVSSAAMAPRDLFGEGACQMEKTWGFGPFGPEQSVGMGGIRLIRLGQGRRTFCLGFMDKGHLSEFWLHDGTELKCCRAQDARLLKQGFGGTSRRKDREFSRHPSFMSSEEQGLKVLEASEKPVAKTESPHKALSF